jgi:uncharacterized Zn finger protein
MIDRARVRSIQAKIQKALKEIEAEENVTISLGGASFNSAYYTTKLKVSTNVKNDVVKGVYESVCRRIGFTQDIVGMSFDQGGITFEVTEIKTRNRKYPVIAKNKAGKSYKFTVEVVKRLMGGDKIVNRNANLEKLV